MYSSRSLVSSLGGGAGADFFFVFRCAATSKEITVKSTTNQTTKGIRLLPIILKCLSTKAENVQQTFCAFRAFSWLLNERAGTTPTRVDKEIDQDSPTCVRRTFVVGPVHKHCTTKDEIARHEAPVTTIFAVVPVVAHHEITRLGHDDLIFALKGVVILSIIRRAGFVINIVDLTGFARWDIFNLQRI